MFLAVDNPNRSQVHLQHNNSSVQLTRLSQPEVALRVLRDLWNAFGHSSHKGVGEFFVADACLWTMSRVHDGIVI